MRLGHHLQHFCSSCSKIPKDSTTLEIQNQQIKEEECPSCGLVDTLQNRTVSAFVPEQAAIVTNAIPKPLHDLSVEFRTAFHQIEDSNSIKFAFDIEKIDLLLNLNTHGSLCVISKQKYT
jgi:hypothetical protein